MKKWDAMREAIPGVADRLVSLKILHEQGANNNNLNYFIINPILISQII